MLKMSKMMISIECFKMPFTIKSYNLKAEKFMIILIRLLKFLKEVKRKKNTIFKIILRAFKKNKIN